MKTNVNAFETVEFVGGPKDGLQMELPRGLAWFDFPLPPALAPVRMSVFDELTDVQPVWGRRAHYRRRPVILQRRPGESVMFDHHGDL